MKRPDPNTVIALAVYALFAVLIAAMIVAHIDARDAMTTEQRVAYDQCIRLGGSGATCAAAITVKP